MLPFAFLGITVIIGHDPMPLIHGYLVGHLYYFLAYVVPQGHEKDVLATPQFLVDHLGVGEHPPPHVRVAPTPAHLRQQLSTQQWHQGGGRVAVPGGAAAGGRGRSGGYNWGGGGRTLGRG